MQHPELDPSVDVFNLSIPTFLLLRNLFMHVCFGMFLSKAHLLLLSHRSISIL